MFVIFSSSLKSVSRISETLSDAVRISIFFEKTVLLTEFKMSWVYFVLKPLRLALSITLSGEHRVKIPPKKISSKVCSAALSKSAPSEDITVISGKKISLSADWLMCIPQVIL